MTSGKRFPPYLHICSCRVGPVLWALVRISKTCPHCCWGTAGLLQWQETAPPLLAALSCPVAGTIGRGLVRPTSRVSRRFAERHKWSTQSFIFILLPLRVPVLPTSLSHSDWFLSHVPQVLLWQSFCPQAPSVPPQLQRKA